MDFPRRSLIRLRPILFPKYWFKRTFCILHHPGEGDYDFNDVFKADVEFDELRNNYIVDGRKALSVFVCQPYLKLSGSFVESKSPPELRLQEAISLVHSIPNWKTCDAGLFPVPDYQKPLFFSEKIVEQLKGRAAGSTMTGLFIAANQLLGKQQFALEKVLGIPVFDRFSIILEIFKHYAVSAEARVQLGLAEIHYLKSRIGQLTFDSHGNRYSMGKSARGTGLTPKQKYQKLLDNRYRSLRRALEKIERNKEQTRNHRKEMQLPSISVIGYTNSGKTSLIKALSQDGNLSPEDRLFATLQTTAHGVKLPNFRKVLFLDSVGFISDIPEHLMDSFNATFKDVIQSDLLVHVYDASHPDLKNQRYTVSNTLEFLKFPQHLISSMINVANKVDLIEASSLEEREEISENDIRISAVNGNNLNQLINEVDSKLCKITGQQIVKIKVANGGEELSWLYRESKIQSVEPDTDPNFLTVRTMMNEAQRNRFLAFIRKKHQ